MSRCLLLAKKKWHNRIADYWNNGEKYIHHSIILLFQHSKSFLNMIVTNGISVVPA
jgi:hypothetical protein